MNYFIFYREKDLCHYLWNGEFPISLDNDQESWASNETTKQGSVELYVDTQLQAEIIAHDKPLLDEVNNSKKRTFTIRGQKYIVLQRGEFVTE